MPWKRNEVKALAKARRNGNIQVIRDLVDQNPDLLNAPIEEYNHRTIVYVCTKKLDDPKWRKTLNYFLDNYGSQIDLDSERKNSNYSAFRIILKTRGHDHATEEVFHKFLKIKPDIVQLPDSRFGCTALHHAVEGKNLDIIEYLVEEALIDPCAVNREGKNPLVHFLTDIDRQGIVYFDSDQEVMEYLIPLTFTPDCAASIPIELALQIYEDVITSLHGLTNPGLFDLFTDTLYGPAVNSHHWLIRRYLDVFDMDELDAKIRQVEYFGHARFICTFLHDRIETLAIPSSAMELMTRVLYLVGREAIGNRDRMMCFFQLLNAAPKELTQRPEFPLLYVPPEPHQTREVARQMHEILEELHGEAPAKLEEVVRGIFEYAKKNGKNPFEENNGFVDLRSFSLLYSFSARPERQMVKLKGPRKEDFAYTNALDVYLPFMPKKLLVSDEGRTVPLVLRLKDLCRIEIRATLEARADDDFGKLMRLIEGLPLPDPVKNYLRYLENVL